MKRTTIALTMLVVCISMLGACKKKEPAVNFTPSMSMNVNGIAKTSANVAAVYYNTLGTMTVVGYFTDGSTISFQVSNIAMGALGSFDASTNSLIATYSAGNIFTAATGTLNITLFNNGVLSGNFDLTASDTEGQTEHITAGTFLTTYTTHSSVIGLNMMDRPERKGRISL